MHQFTSLRTLRFILPYVCYKHQITTKERQSYSSMVATTKTGNRLLIIQTKITCIQTFHIIGSLALTYFLINSKIISLFCGSIEFRSFLFPHNKRQGYVIIKNIYVKTKTQFVNLM